MTAGVVGQGGWGDVAGTDGVSCVLERDIHVLVRARSGAGEDATAGRSHKGRQSQVHHIQLLLL